MKTCLPSSPSSSNTACFEAGYIFEMRIEKTILQRRLRIKKKSASNSSSKRIPEWRQKIRTLAILVLLAVLTTLQLDQSQRQHLLLDRYTRNLDQPFPRMVYWKSSSLLEADNNDTEIPEQSSQISVMTPEIGEAKSNTALLFHLIHSTDEASFGLMPLRCIESIFYHHPNAIVRLYVNNMSHRPVQPLLKAGYNISIIPYNVTATLQDLQHEFNDELILKFMAKVDDYANDEQGFWYSNVSNLLRLALLFQHGGVYLDTDTIVVRPFTDMKPNILGRQDKYFVNGAVMYFEPRHDYIRQCLWTFVKRFDNRLWGNNGPALLTKVYKQRKSDWKIQIARSHVFYPFYYKSIMETCYNETIPDQVQTQLQRVRKSSYAVHMNNHVAGEIVHGSPCHCLLNSYCVVGKCHPGNECRALTGNTEAAVPTNDEILTPDIIPFENMRSTVLSAGARNVSSSVTLFHLIHTTKEENFGTMQKRCLESIFFHHPNAKVIVHAKAMTDTPVRYLIDAGYDLSVQPYDPVQGLKRLWKKHVFPDNLVVRFMNHVSEYANDPGGNWFSNESNLMRMILMYLDGGVYLDTDTIVVRPLDSLPPNVIGFQDKERTSLNGAVLKFQPGHKYMEATLLEFLSDFNNRLWGYNGPRLLTRVYFSASESWDLEPLDPLAFQYFSWSKISRECYKDTREYKVFHRLNGIRENSYIVHLNNHVGGMISDGSSCDCLYRAFCLSSNCEMHDRCRPLLQEIERPSIRTGIDDLDEMDSDDMLSLPTNRYRPRSPIGSFLFPLRIYVYNQTVGGKEQHLMADAIHTTATTARALYNLFGTSSYRTFDAKEADVFVVPHSFFDLLLPSCSNETGGGESCAPGSTANDASFLEFFSANPHKHLFLLPDAHPPFTVPFFLNRSMIVFGDFQSGLNRTFDFRVPTVQPHRALQPSAISHRTLDWWTRPRQYAFTATDISGNYDRRKVHHQFVKHVRGWNSVGSLPFLLLERMEVGATELLSYLQESVFCPCFFEDDDSELQRFFQSILNGCIPVVPRYNVGSEGMWFPKSELPTSDFLPYSTLVNYSSFVLEAEASDASKGSFIVAIKAALKDRADVSRRQEKLREYAMLFSYGLGPDAHTHEDAFAQLLRFLEGHLQTVSSQ